MIDSGGQNTVLHNYQKAVAAFGKREYAQAIALLRPLVIRMPHIAEAHHLLGICHYMSNRLVEAERSIRKALSIAKHPDFYLNLGLVLQQAGNPDAAAEAYRASLDLNPRSPQACNNLANILSTLNRNEEAIELYRQALVLRPEYAIGHKNLGARLVKLKRYEEAETALRRAIALDGSFVEAKEMLADLLVRTERFDEGFEIYRSIGAWGRLQFEMRKIAHWTGLAGIERACLAETEPRNATIAAPWSLILMPGVSPALEMKAAYGFAVKELAELQAPSMCKRSRVGSANRRLRIGYLSSDFFGHATMHLLAGVLEAHDRVAHDITIFSYSPKREDEFAERLHKTGLPVVDVSTTSNQEAAQEIVQREIDILIDLKGFTSSARLGITALRPAPIIVNWLGYPGTLGHKKLADYIIGDKIVTPPEDAKFYTERLALMPNSYQPNDRMRPLPEPPSRGAAGLPESGLVFCSFNQVVKFNPRTFDIWAQLLKAVPDSVLWLLKPKVGVACENISRELAARGVAAERIIFAPFVSQAEHAARLRLCDFVLDTFPYNSHTTASDALWAGIPLVTMKGKTFASRVAASLLTAHGFPDLITQNEVDYFRLALEISTNEARRMALKDRLDRARKTSPLFDTQRFTCDLEALYRAIVADRNQPAEQRAAVVAIG